jgi:tRNA threonylcarbamoyladenosine biosynthesis protein TsaB
MGLAYGLGVKIAAVDTLMALSLVVEDSGDLICPIIDAKRGEVYTGLYQTVVDGTIPETIVPPCAIPLKKLADLLPSGESIVFTGPGIDRFRPEIEKLSIREKIFAPHEKTAPTANNVAIIGISMFERGLGVSPSAIEPVYLRRSDAELAKNICRIKHQ